MHSDQGAREGSGLPELESPARNYGQPQSLAGPRPGKELSHSLTHCGECLPGASDQRCWWERLKAVPLRNTSAETQAELNGPRAKPVLGMGGHLIGTAEGLTDS